MVQFYQNGGAFMHPLLLLMLIGIALGLFKLFQLYRVRRASRPFINEVAEDLVRQTFPPVIDRCASTPGPVASVIRSGLLSRQKGIETMRSIMSAVGDIEYAFLERGLSWMNFIIVIAPLLGFTGTVWGMVIAFEQIRIEDNISPAVVAGGISQALL
ncbi:MAG: MotA/TolQ/ExbB proton channel family protein, partial [Calditrichota bacterium]